MKCLKKCILTEAERGYLFDAAYRLYDLNERALRDENEALAIQISHETTAILLAIAILDEIKIDEYFPESQE